MSGKGANGLPRIGELEGVEEGKDGGIEHSQDDRHSRTKACAVATLYPLLAIG
jgi:hypothetical protein